METYVNRTALAFIAKLKGYLGNDWVKVESGAHPNDLCDANHLLIEAFADVYGREPYFPSDVETGFATEDDVDADFETLERIWEYVVPQAVSA